MVDSTTTLPRRSEIDDKYKWNAESVYADVAAWQRDAETLKAMIPELQAFQGRLKESSDVLADFLGQFETSYRILLDLYFYPRIRVECDSHDEEATALVGQANAIYGELAGATSFLDPELIAIGQSTLEDWIAHNPGLVNYEHYLDNLFRMQKHVRSEEVEQVMGLAVEVLSGPETIYDKLINADMKFAPAIDSSGKELVVSQSTVEAIYQNSDREARRTAYESYNGKYVEMRNTLATVYLNNVRQDVFKMRVRGFNSSLEAALFSDNIDPAVFHNLIETSRKNLPLWHKYWRVRRKALGVETLQPYDIWAPIADPKPSLTYEEAVDWVCAGMQPLGDEYVSIMRKGCLEDRWVDVFPNEGKQQGAFSTGTYNTNPVIIMSFDNGMVGFSTLAHELGHSMHSYYANQHQPWINHQYSLFVAEVASNFNQATVRAYLRETKKDDVQFQIALIEEAMENIHRYFFIMPTLARFELEVHERVEKGQGLSAKDLITICAEYFSEGYGGEMYIDQDLVGITWATFGHLYTAFYTYQYATGISAAHDLSRRILDGEEGAVQRYLEMLSAGSSLYPMDALLHAGVDMTKPDAVESTYAILSDMVDRLEELVG